MQDMPDLWVFEAILESGISLNILKDIVAKLK
jgi:hypothetical protein